LKFLYFKKNCLFKDEWAAVLEECRGNNQSPINIAEKFAEYDKDLKPFVFINHEFDYDWRFTNDGHTSVYFLILSLFIMSKQLI
jgi:hypothetical protein